MAKKRKVDAKFIVFGHSHWSGTRYVFEWDKKEKRLEVAGCVTLFATRGRAETAIRRTVKGVRNSGFDYSVQIARNFDG